MTVKVAEFLAQNPIVTLFAVIGIGYLLGEIRFFGFRLGVAGILFTGLAFGALGPQVALPPMVSSFGLVLFIYSIGVQFGPDFIRPFGPRGYRDNLFCLAMLLVGAVTALCVARWQSLGSPEAAGLFCGALTNAPALAAAQDLLRQQSPASVDKPVVAFGIAYPLGVLGVMLSFQLYRVILRVKLGPPASGPTIEVGSFVVTNPDCERCTIHQVLERAAGTHFVVTRIRRNGTEVPAAPDMELLTGDLLAVVGTPEALLAARNLIGSVAMEPMKLDRGVLDYRRIFVSSPEAVGKSIEELDLQRKHSATITRIRRGDLDMVPSPQTRLAYGDRVRVLSAPSNLPVLSQFFGDSIRGTSEIDFGSVGLGLSAGIILGLIPFPLPGGASLSLGLAGGPLIAGLIFGHLERTGPLTWSIPLSANLTLRQIGLVLFQAGVGTRAGYGFLETVRATGMSMIVAGAVITFAVALTSVFVGHRLLKRSFESVMGLTTAIHTEPASLAFAGMISSSDEPQAAYARVFPLCTIAKIVLAQAIVLWKI